jgi:hypothetical protein
MQRISRLSTGTSTAWRQVIHSFELSFPQEAPQFSTAIRAVRLTLTVAKPYRHALDAGPLENSSAATAAE